jgi:hypothetical protein
MVCPPFMSYFEMCKRVVHVAITRRLRNKGHDFARPGAFGIHGCAHHDILRERRAVGGEVALEKGVPRDAENAGVVENRNGVANLRGPIAVAAVEAPGAAILRAGGGDLAQFASAVVIASVDIKRSVVNEGGGTETGRSA